jgi:glycosyltransferase involved in cell wall biosynthesis
MAVECTVVIPACNEESTLASTVRALAQALERAGSAFEVVVVDDGSTDGTWRAIRELAAAEPRVSGLRLSRNFGKEAAIRAGLEAARGRAVLVMDADAQHPPEVAGALLERWRRGDVAIVEGVKARRGDEGTPRATQARWFYRVFRNLTGQDLEGAADFKLLDRHVVDQYLALPESSLFFRGLTAWMGFPTARIPFEVAPRAGGGSTWSAGKLTRMALRAVTSFTSAPLHLITLMGLGFFAFAVLLGLQTLWRKLAGTAVDGFTTVILLILITGSAIMIGLGVIGEYIARIYEEVKRRPRYLVSDRTDNKPLSQER